MWGQPPSAVRRSRLRTFFAGGAPAPNRKRKMAKVAGILGKKVGMTQLFDSKGEVRPATVLQAGPGVVTQHKSQTRDGYDSAQIGLVEVVKESRLQPPARGHLTEHIVT